MEYLRTLFITPSITQSLIVLVLTIATGIFLADKLKIKSFSLGVTWILFCGILYSHFGLRLMPEVGQFAKDFGLILFVYSIGLSVGPSFFSSFGKGGIKLNGFAMLSVALSCLTTIAIAYLSDENMGTMIGVMSGAVTNTPSLGAAEQAYFNIFGVSLPSIATGYAVAYPLGVVGVILSMLILRAVFRVSFPKEEKRLKEQEDNSKVPVLFEVVITNPQIEKMSIRKLHHTLNIPMVVSRIIYAAGEEIVPQAETTFSCGDTLRVLTDIEHQEVLMLIGQVMSGKQERETHSSNLVSRRIAVTKPEWNGKQIRRLGISDKYHVNVTRVNRAGIELLATADIHLQLGDRITVVGDKEDVQKVADLFGNELKKLDIPNLFPIFFGMVLGIIAGTLPIYIPGLGQPFRLGLAGGSLIVAILIGHFGPYHHLVTFSTTSANMMIREIGISLFLAAVGLGAGTTFVPTLLAGGWVWIIYGVVITMLPMLVTGFAARKWGKLDFFSLMGMLSGSATNPSALAYATSCSETNSKASLSYATVYPLTMFVRVLLAQIMIIFLC